MNGCPDEHCHSESPSAVHALDTISCGGGVFLVGDDVFVQELSKPGLRHREGGYGTVAAVNEDGTFNVKYVHGELEKRVTVDRLSLSTLLFQSRGKRRKRTHAKDAFAAEFSTSAPTTSRTSTGSTSSAAVASKVALPEPLRQCVSKLRQWINKVADVRGIDRVLANTEESSSEEHREPPQDLEDVLKKALAGLYVGWYDVRTRQLCTERTANSLAVIHWETVGVDISRMLEAAASVQPMAEGGHEALDDVSATCQHVMAQVTQRIEHEVAVQQTKIDEAMKKDAVKFLQERNGLAAVSGPWRKAPYPHRSYEPLQSYVAAEGISEEDRQEVLGLLDTPLNGFLGQPYNVDDQDMTEEWMVSFEDSKAQGVSDDDVIRTQIVALMDLLTAEVCDRVLNDMHILDVPPLVLGQDVEEAPVWGIDSYTRRSIELAIKDSLPAASQTMITRFIEDWLLPAINAQPPEEAHDMATSLQAIIDSPTSEQRWKDFASATLTSLQRYGNEHFRIHPKGTGVICRKAGGIPAHVFVTEYLGELYPPWRWCEKQDAIEFAQAHFSIKPTLPDFYNILLERPRSDPKGYGLLFVDASVKANLGSSCSHSCDSNCTTSVVARNGKLAIALHSVRPIRYGEELTMDYYSITTKEDEWRAAICLCGMRTCRESFLHFATMDDLQQIMQRSYGPMFRFASLLRACSKKPLNDQDKAILKRHGIGEAALGAEPPLWALRYTAEVLRFVEFERKALPCALLRPANGQPSLYTFTTADLDARSVMEQRLQSLVCSFSLISRFIKSQPKEKLRTQAPIRLLSQAEASERIWNLLRPIPRLLVENAEKVASSRKSALEGMTEEQTSQLVSDMMVAASQVQELLDRGTPAHVSELKQGLRAVREILLPLPAEPHPTVRLGLLCDVLLLWASTTNFTAVQPYASFTSAPVEVLAKDLGGRVPKSIIRKKERKTVTDPPTVAALSPQSSSECQQDTAGLEEIQDTGAPNTKKLATLTMEDDAASGVASSSAAAAPPNGSIGAHPEEEYFSPMDVVYSWRKQYSPSFVFSQLMCWFNNGQSTTAADLFGCVRLPLPGECFGDGSSYTTKIREKLWKLLADDKKQTMPWPQEIKSCFSSQASKKTSAEQDLGHILGSPMLDVALGNVSALDDVLREMGNCLRAVSHDYQLLQWDNKLPPEVPTDWVQCDRCKKWRRLPWHVDVDSLADPWFCEMNDWDPVTANCDAPQDSFDPERENTVQYTEGVIEAYEVGQWFDVYCLQNHVYYEAKIVRVGADNVTVHFKGWSSKYDETIEKGSTRIQPHNMFTKPGANPNQQEKYQAIHRPGARSAADETVSQKPANQKRRASGGQQGGKGKTPPKKRKSTGKPGEQETPPKKERAA